MQNKFSFHAGERAVQMRANEAFIADRNATVIADTILGGARPFIEKQFMVVLSSIAADGDVWSSVLYGEPGFARTDTDNSITLTVPLDQRDEFDPLWANINTNPSVGLLFIELGSRRRYRINGIVQQISDQSIEIDVSEAYPNCPKYIQRRHLRKIENQVFANDTFTGNSLNESIKVLIQNADTMFVASNYVETGADASHRGGNPGFVQVINDKTLRIPDYNGNSLFNTLGNIELDPRSGLCIPDFEEQKLLQLTGTSRLLWDQEDPHNLTGGTQRFWEFEVKQWVLRRIPQLLEWEYLDASPFNLPTEA